MLWIDTGTDDGTPLGHPYAGYYLPYPDTKYEGLVTTITDVAPIMNWVYIDKETCEVKYGVRADAQPNLTGPFDCTRQDRRLTFDGWEGWCAVERAPGLWGLYFDLDDDGLKSRLDPGTKVLEIELSRKEKRFQKETEARQQDQTTKRAVDTKEEAPTDQPLAQEALVSNPGVVDEKVPEMNTRETYKDRPMRIPKSIFENPPPMIESMVFRAASPPPAYTPAIREEPRAAEPKNERQAVNVPDTDNAQIPEPPASQSVQAPSRQNNEIQTKDTRVKTPPVEQQLPATTEKRTTPKLNRNSGSRTLAQAQKFEAMSAAQKPLDDVQKRSGKRGSRANSHSSSVYSNDSEIPEQPKSTVTQSQSSATPAPLALAVSKAKQAKALAARASTPVGTEPTLDPFIQQPITPPRQRAPSLREDPAVSEPRRSTSQRTSSQRSSASRTAPSQRSSAQRMTSQAPGQRPASNRQQRDRSILDTSSSNRQQRDRSSSETPSLSHSSPRPAQSAAGPSRPSLARTMTSGKGNQGMSNRMGGRGYTGRDRDASSPGGRSSPAAAATQNRLRAGTVGRKTTSALFREIDELVSQEGSTGATADARAKNERK